MSLSRSRDDSRSINFNIVDLSEVSMERRSRMDAVKLRIDPPESYIAAGNFNRGMFLCRKKKFRKYVGVVVSAYILKPDGNTCYADELLNPNKERELFGFLNGEQITCSVLEAKLVKGVCYKWVHWEEPADFSNNRWSWTGTGEKVVTYDLFYDNSTEVVPRLVKFDLSGLVPTHFGSRYPGNLFIEK